MHAGTSRHPGPVHRRSGKPRAPTATRTTRWLRPETLARYRKDKAHAEQRTHVSFVGRPATCQYDETDQMLAQALTLFRKLAAQRADGPRPFVQGGLEIRALRASA